MDHSKSLIEKERAKHWHRLSSVFLCCVCCAWGCKLKKKMNKTFPRKTIQFCGSYYWNNVFLFLYFFSAWSSDNYFICLLASVLISANILLFHALVSLPVTLSCNFTHWHSRTDSSRVLQIKRASSYLASCTRGSLKKMCKTQSSIAFIHFLQLLFSTCASIARSLACSVRSRWSICRIE